MDRYRQYTPGDDAPINDGDGYFLGFYSRLQPTYLKAGQLFYAGNMRMDRGTCRVRKGLLALSTDVNLTNPPLIVGATTLATSFSVSSLTRSGTTATAATTTAHGYATSNRVNIRGAAQSAYNGDFTITVTGASGFTYTVAGSPTTPATGTIFANKGPRVFNNYASQAVGSGDYANQTTNEEGIVIASTSAAYLYRYGQSTITISYPANETCDVGSPCDLVLFLGTMYLFRGYSTAAALTVSSITRSSTTATITTSSAHGLSTGNWVAVVGASPDGYNGIAQVTVTTSTAFTYTVSSSLTTPATGTITARPCKPPLQWNLNTSTAAFTVVTTGPNAAGAPLINIPAVDWGMFFKSRLVLPWSRDQLVLSDIDDASTYDPSQNQFRIHPGTADWLIAAYPYQEGRLLALYRKSVHALVLDNTDLSIAQAFEITRAFGCVGRRTVVNCGPYVIWLSDRGVVKMDVTDELSLKSTTAPMSDPIQDIIDTINWPYAANAVATFWNNRYYLAVPIDTSTTNNTVLVYNFLNDAWESVDTFPAGYDVLNFHILSYNGTKRIHTVSTAGYVFLMEEGEVDEWGAPQSVMEFPIQGSMQTRSYLADTYEIKRLKRFQLEANVSSGDTFTVTTVLSNPDLTTTSLTYVADDTSDKSIRGMVNRRGNSWRFEIATTVGRPEFKAIANEAMVTSRATLNYP
jgi:hypothetical protein